MIPSEECVEGVPRKLVLMWRSRVYASLNEFVAYEVIGLLISNLLEELPRA